MAVFDRHFGENYPVAALLMTGLGIACLLYVVAHDPSNIDDPKDLPNQYGLNVNSLRVIFTETSSKRTSLRHGSFFQNRILQGTLPAASRSGKNISCTLNQKIKWTHNLLFSDYAWKIDEQTVSCDLSNNQKPVFVDFTPI